MRRLSRWEAEEDLLNLTPLLDVLFTILIFFILVAPMVDIDRVDLAPSSEKKEELSPNQAQTPIKIYLTKDNLIYIGNHNVSLSDLGKALEELHKMAPDEIPELFPDTASRFGMYQEIKNLVELAGFSELDVVLKGE